jgi:hypothetical protein
MSNTQQISKSMQWYFHPVERIRMLRYFQLNMQFDKTVDYTPTYSENPEIGIIINANENIQYLDLHLHYLKNVNNFIKILVYDNCSNIQKELKSLCNEYNVEFYSSPNKLYSDKEIGNISDIDIIYQGLLWAKQNNIEVLVKFNVDIIPCYNWKSNFLSLIKESNGITFASSVNNNDYNINFNSDFIGFYVPVWSSNYPLQCMLFTIQNEMPVCTNIWLHELSKTLSCNNFSEHWFNYCKQNKIDYLHSGYTHWNLLLNKDTLYTIKNNERDYFNKIEKVFSNKYTKDKI